MLKAMRSDANKLSSADYEYILQYKDAKSKPLDMLKKKYPMSNSRFYRIWRGEEIYVNNTSSSSNIDNNISTPVAENETKKKKSKSKSVHKPELISSNNSMTANPDNSTEKISGKKLDVLYEERIRKNEEYRAKMANIVNNT